MNSGVKVTFSYFYYVVIHIYFFSRALRLLSSFVIYFLSFTYLREV